MDFVVKIYQITSTLPTEEKFGLSQQMRRAAVSIPSNIAEGAARKSSNEFVQFLHIALGSLSELETQLLISDKLGFYLNDTKKVYEDCTRIRQMLIGLIRHQKS